MDLDLEFDFYTVKRMYKGTNIHSDDISKYPVVL